MSRNLRGWTQATQGNCPGNLSIQQCRDAGLDPGSTLYRTDSYTDAKSVLVLKQREQQCKEKGLQGLALRQCISPPAKNPSSPLQ
jgi:hypothetical protein